MSRWAVDPIGAFKSWRARRRHRGLVRILRAAERELAEAEGKQKRLEELQAYYHANGSFGSIQSRDDLIEYAGEVAELRKRVEHCKQDVFT